MLILITLVKGLAKAFRNWQAIAMLAVIQLLLAWLLAVPMTSELHNRWDHSMLPAADATVLPQAETIAWDEILIAQGSGLSAVYNSLVMPVAGVAYILFTALVLAGVLPLFSGLDLKFNWDRFWSNASRYFRPFVGLALIAALLFWAADAAGILLNDLVNDALAGNDDEASVFITGVLVTGSFRFLLFAMIVMIFQYAKAVASTEGLRNIIYLTRKAVSFVSRHFVTALLLFSLLGAIELGILALDTAVWHFALPGADPAFSWFWLVVVTVLLAGIKLGFYASQVLLYVEISRRTNEGVRVELDAGQYNTAF